MLKFRRIKIKDLLKDFFVGFTFLTIFIVLLMVIPNMPIYEYTLGSMIRDILFFMLGMFSIAGIIVLTCSIGGNIRKLIRCIKGSEKEILDYFLVSLFYLMSFNYKEK